MSSQNVSANPNGAYTGEVSAEQLVDAGIKWTIIGHSERRQSVRIMSFESNFLVSQKVAHLSPLFLFRMCGSSRSASEQRKLLYFILIRCLVFTFVQERQKNKKSQNHPYFSFFFHFGGNSSWFFFHFSGNPRDFSSMIVELIEQTGQDCDGRRAVCLRVRRRDRDRAQGEQNL